MGRSGQRPGDDRECTVRPSAGPKWPTHPSARRLVGMGGTRDEEASIGRGMDGPAVTIVLTTFQRGHVVASAIDSVLAQTYPALDVVVVDDGSTDDTPTVLARYADDPRVRIVTLPRNSGATAAKNAGLDALPGPCDLFGMVDSDDRLLPTAVEHVVGAFEGHGRRPSLVFAWGQRRDTGAPTGVMAHLSGREGPVTYDDALAGHFQGDFWHLARRDILADMRFEPRALGAEGSVWWRFLRAGPGWLIPEVALEVDTSGDDRLSVRADGRRYAEGMMWGQQAMLDAVGPDLFQSDRRTFGRWQTDLAKWSILAGEPARARTAARHGMRLAPSLRAVVTLGLSILPASIGTAIAHAAASRRRRSVT